MTFTLKPRKGWTPGYFDPAENAVYFAAPTEFFETPQEVLERSHSLNFGPGGLVWIYVERNTRRGICHYFQSLAAASRYHKSLSKP